MVSNCVFSTTGNIQLSWNNPKLLPQLACVQMIHAWRHLLAFMYFQALRLSL